MSFASVIDTTILNKARKYCSYQERSQQEVRDKLYELGLHKKEVEQTIALMVEEKYLNEERFAIAYAGGKFRSKKWGKKKIIYQLKAKGINGKLIQQALGEIKESDYKETLLAELKKKDGIMKELNPLKRMAKISKYLFGKGFEQDMVIDAVKKYYNKWENLFYI